MIRSEQVYTSIIFEMYQCRADKNWRHFHKIEWFESQSYLKMLTQKVVVQRQNFQNRISILLEKSRQFLP